MIRTKALLIIVSAALFAGYDAAPILAVNPQARPDLGPNVSLHGRRPFPDDNPWNQRIDQEPVDPNSRALVERIGGISHLHPDFGNGPNDGIPYMIVSGSEPKVPLVFDINSESDPGPYPIPLRTPIEGGITSKGDRHTIVIDRDNWKLYETWKTYHRGAWVKAGCGAIFDLDSSRLRPAGWTSADAAGLPIFPGLVRYDEVVERAQIKHALRFTVKRTRRAYVPPARHFASTHTDEELPPMGMRVRLKASYDIAEFPESAQVILRALKTYGMILADNGGNWYLSGAPDLRWDMSEIYSLMKIQGRDFEVVKMEEPSTK